MNWDLIWAILIFLGAITLYTVLFFKIDKGIERRKLNSLMKKRVPELDTQIKEQVVKLEQVRLKQVETLKKFDLTIIPEEVSETQLEFRSQQLQSIFGLGEKRGFKESHEISGWKNHFLRQARYIIRITEELAEAKKERKNIVENYNNLKRK